MRFKLFDQVWHRATTRYKDLSFAKRVAGNLYDRAKFKEEMGIPQTTRRYSVAAEECLKRLEQEIEQRLPHDEQRLPARHSQIPHLNRPDFRGGYLVSVIALWRFDQ